MNAIVLMSTFMLLHALLGASSKWTQQLQTKTTTDSPQGEEATQQQEQQ
jgi:hypothetical protein